MEKHMAVCPYCGAGCKMNLVVENGQVIDAEAFPVSRMKRAVPEGHVRYDSSTTRKSSRRASTIL